MLSHGYLLELLLFYQGDLKKITIERKSEFVSQDERLPKLFQHLKDFGAKTFLLTNSEWWYTDAVSKKIINFLGRTLLL